MLARIDSRSRAAAQGWSDLAIRNLFIIPTIAFLIIFNVFPLITVTLFLIQQKMFTPPATDEQTKMQQQMMTYMTVFMGVMFYKVPAGLCIYFITSSLWGICERKLLPKSKPKDLSAPDRDEGGGVFARLMPKPATPSNGTSTKTSTRRPRQRK